MTNTAIIPSRLEKVRTILADENLDGLLVTDPDNRRYLSGYTASDHGPTESEGVLLIGTNGQTLMAGPNNAEWAAADAPDYTIVHWSRPIDKSIAKEIDRLGWARVGFEPESTSFALWSGISEYVSSAKLEPLGDGIDRLRWIKDDAEIEALQAVVALTDAAFEQARDWITPGLTEREVARTIERIYLELGADGASFPTIVASGPNGARPHHSPSDRRLRDGDVVIIDMGALLNGYCGDLTRTLFIGDVSDQAREIYAIVGASQQAAFNAIRAGVTGKEVDQASRTVFEEGGYADYMIHSVGHGLGLRVHDGPSVSIKAEGTLEPGHVVTIEPGLYVPGVLGVRTEDVVLVEENGYRLLSHAPKAPFTVAVKAEKEAS